MITNIELRRRLEQFPDDMPVVLNGYEGGYDDPKELTPVSVFKDPDPYCGVYSRVPPEEDIKEFDALPIDKQADWGDMEGFAKARSESRIIQALLIPR